MVLMADFISLTCSFYRTLILVISRIFFPVFFLMVVIGTTFLFVNPRASLLSSYIVLDIISEIFCQISEKMNFVSFLYIFIYINFLPSKDNNFFINKITERNRNKFLVMCICMENSAIIIKCTLCI